MERYPNPALFDVLQEAYAPCVNFGVCREARWQPADGHMPRGFLGATGALNDVEVVMVFAEPGKPHAGERYAGASRADLLRAGVEHTYKCFSAGTDKLHQNARWFLDQLHPDLSFDEQLRHVWMTEGRLCSIADEIGNMRDRTCAKHYLAQQIALFPNAKTVAFGSKAHHYMQGMNTNWIRAFALSPPGANQKKARPSWLAAIDRIKCGKGEARANG